MNIKHLLTTLAFLHLCILAYSQDFNTHFEDKTLRLDYTFSGTRTEQVIALDELCQAPRWYGKRTRLAEVPVEGNGQVIVKDKKSGEVIYRNSFSTLFQEWQDEAAADERRAFENVFLVPMPKDTALVTVRLTNNRREVTAEATNTIVPTDILIRRLAVRRITPFETLQQAADTTRCIHIAYVAEGYTESEMPTFISDARMAMDALFSHEPFKGCRDRFNIVAVKSPSAESGVSEPGKNVWKNTAMHSSYDTFYSERYLTTLHLKDLHNFLAGIPYEHIIVLVNSERYGGGGVFNSYTLSTAHNKLTRPVVVHEFGHSFAGLADEYNYDNEDYPMYPHDVEPWERNITTLTDFHGKWENMIKKGTPIPTPPGKDADPTRRRIGVYEGAGYSAKGVYRPTQDCRMRTNTNPEFCPVCQKALADIIDFYTK